MSGIIQDLLGCSRIGLRGERGEPVDCTAVFDEAVQNLWAAIEENDALVAHDDLPVFLGIHARLVHSSQNRICNATRYRGNRRPRIHAFAKRAGGESLFSVCDNRIGIAAEHLDRIFAILKRLYLRDPHAGTQIGLPFFEKLWRCTVAASGLNPNRAAAACFALRYPIEMPEQL